MPISANVVARCGGWLNATLYYARNLPQVKTIVENFKGSGITVTQANVSSQTKSLVTQLLKIKRQYERLDKLIETTKSAKHTIKKAM